VGGDGGGSASSPPCDIPGLIEDLDFRLSIGLHGKSVSPAGCGKRWEDE
jgi:hypothetical protein